MRSRYRENHSARGVEAFVRMQMIHLLFFFGILTSGRMLQLPMIENIAELSDNLQKSPYRRLFESPVAMPGVLRSHVIPPTLGTTLCISFSGSTTSHLELELFFFYTGMSRDALSFSSRWMLRLPISTVADSYSHPEGSSSIRCFRPIPVLVYHFKLSHQSRIQPRNSPM